MVTKVVWTEPAKIRLREISDYYKSIAGDKVARKIRDKIYSRTMILSANPQAGPREVLLRNRAQEFRYLIEGNYKVVYWLEQGKAMIATVFDCRRDPESMQKEIL